MQPRSPRLLPELKSPKGCCFPEVNQEALPPKPSTMEMAILDPTLLPWAKLQRDPGSSLEWRGLSKAG